jgi:hypothetical protein
MGDLEHDFPDLGRQDFTTAVALSGLGHFEMWVRYFSLGGQASPLELDAFLNKSITFSDTEYNVMVQALNERLQEIGLEPLLELRVPRVESPRTVPSSERKEILRRSVEARSFAKEQCLSATEMRLCATEMRTANRRLHSVVEEHLGRAAALRASLGLG